MGAPMKKAATKATKQMTKSEIAKTLAEQHELKQKVCSDVLASFVEIACAEVKKNGIFTVPGLCRKNSCQTSDKGRSEEHLRQGTEGCRQACSQNRQGLPRGSFE